MGTKVIGATLRLAGENEFNNAVKNCNRSLKEMQSALKLVKEQTATSANSYDSLRQRQEALTKVMDAHRAKQQELSRALNETKNDYAKIGAATDEAGQKYSHAKQELDKLKASETATNEEIAEQQKLVDRLKREFDAQSREYEKAGASVQGWQTKLNSAEAELVKTNREIDENARLMAEADANTDQCAHSIDQFGKKVNNSSLEFKQAQITMQKAVVWNVIQQNAEKAAAAIRKISSAALDAAKDYENGFAKVATIADSQAVSLDGLKSSMLQLSSDTGRGIGEITEATYQAISASVDTADAVGFVQNATNLAKTGFLETGDAVDVLTTIINAYKLSASDTEAISDKLIQTQNKGKTTVNQLSQSMGQVIPLAAAYNVNLDNLSAAYVELTKNGIGTAEAGTMLKGMFSELAKDGTSVSKILKDKTGKSFGELMKDGSSLGEVLDILYQSVEGNSEAFSNLWSNVRARTGALSLAQTGAEEFNAELQGMAESTGNVSEALEKLDTPTAKANKAMNALKNAGATVGDAFLSAAAPAMNVAAQAAQSLAKWVNGLSGPLKTAVGVGGGAVAMLAAALPKIIAFKNTVQSLKTLREATAAIKALKTEMSGVDAAAQAGGGGVKGIIKSLKSLATPAGIGVTAVAGLVAGFIALDNAFRNAAAASNPYHQAIEEVKSKNEELKESISSTKSAFEESFNNAEVDATMAGGLKDQLDELMGMENKDAEAKERIKAVVDELNGVIPGLALAYDETTDSLNLSNSAIEESIQLMEQQAKAAAYQEAYTAALKEQAEAEMTLSKAQDTVRNMTKGLSDEDRAAYAQLVRNNENLQLRADLAAKLSGQYSNTMLATEELTGALRGLNEAQDNYNEITEDTDYYGDKYIELQQDLKDAIGETAEAQAESKEAQGEYSAAAAEAMAEVEEAAEGAAQSYADLRDAAYESINSQIGLFDEMSTEYDASLEQMNAAMESQKAALDAYASNLGTAQDKIKELPEAQQAAAGEFLASIAEMGIDGAGYLQEFVTALQSGGDEAAQLLSNFADAQEAKENFASAMAEIQADAEDMSQNVAAEMESGAKAAADAVSSEMDTAKSTARKGAKDAAQAVADEKPGFQQAGTESGQAYAQGLQDTAADSGRAAWQHRNAVQPVLSGMSGSSYSWGSEVGSNFAAGISSMASAVGAAASRVAAAAADVLKHSVPKKGPLHTDDKWGGHLVENFVKGINSKIKDAKTAAEKLAKTVSDGVKGKSFSISGNNLQATVSARISSLTKGNQISLVAERNFWLQAAKEAKKGTKAYKTAVKAAEQVKKELNSSQKKLTKELVRGVKETRKEYRAELKELKSDLDENVAEINSNLAQEIKDIEETYKAAVQGRAEAITAAMSLFDSSSMKRAAAYTKKEYTSILRQQVNNIDDWNRALESLSKKIKNQNLLAELENLGVDQVKALQQFDSMTAEELAEYEALFNRREEIANIRAAEENEKLLEETKAQEKALTDAANEEIAALRAAFKEEKKTLKQETQKTIKELRTQYAKDLKELGLTSKTAGAGVGRQVADGISEGIKEGMKGTKEDTKKALKSLLKSIKKTLKINSPSQVMRDEVGLFMAEGIGAGFKDQMKTVAGEMQDAIPANFNVAAVISDTLAGSRNTGYPEEDKENRVIFEQHFYLGERDITDLITKKVTRRISEQRANQGFAKGAASYV